MKIISALDKQNSDYSLSDGSGNYEKYDRTELQEDEDLLVLKTYTKDVTAKEQVSMDLNRI